MVKWFITILMEILLSGSSKFLTEDLVFGRKNKQFLCIEVGKGVEEYSAADMDGICEDWSTMY
ncbi:hypothetical protein HanIR_Chr01g0022491 [Helianthus annuus]|nr:hypothetical protein HanIR_Chr01g0022491 [Helianthus annuus]